MGQSQGKYNHVEENIDEIFDGIVKFGKTMIDNLNNKDYDQKYMGETYNIVVNVYSVLKQKMNDKLLMEIQEKERQYLKNFQDLKTKYEALEKQVKKG